jgi:hypothetical protein
MTAQELHTEILVKMAELKPDFKMGPLHKAMLMECCENVMQPHNTEKYSNEILMLSALQAFEVSQSLMKGMIAGMIPEFADTITLNYRGQTFILDKDSQIVKAALANS